ncbi:hypothetical protein QG37_00587 [Candidozyma auris]|nr:hypothetical protein QG37_00587 [[Candida] auris]
MATALACYRAKPTGAPAIAAKSGSGTKQYLSKITNHGHQKQTKKKKKYNETITVSFFPGWT